MNSAEPEVLANAAGSLARALRSDPQNSAWLEALDALIAQAGEADVIAPLGSDVPFEIAAVHARALHAQGRRADALLLLLDVARCAPEVPFLAWALPWAASLPELDSEQLARAGAALSAVLTAGPPLHLDTRGAAFALLSALALRHPTRSELSLLASLLFRKLGDGTRAEQFAARAYEASPGWLGAIHLATAVRMSGDLDKAAFWYERAIAADPAEPSTYVDLGDVLLDDGRFARAADTYQRALVQGANPDWCEASLLTCRHLLGELAGARDELRRRAQAGVPRAAELLALLDKPPYVSRLPPPAESAARSVASAIELLGASKEAGDAPLELELRVPRLQAPSLMLALSVALAGLGRSAELRLAVEAVGEPDPRVPRDEVPIWLWEYDDMTPRAALPPPSDDVRDAVVALAIEPYSLEGWWSRAESIATKLGPDAASDVLSCMTHIALPPAGVGAIAWVQRVQVAAALVAGRLDAGWESSLRRMLLLSLARGPVDWSITAAIVALFAIARDEPDARAEVLALYTELLHIGRVDSDVCYLHALAACWLALGADDPALRAELWRSRRALDQANQRGA